MESESTRDLSKAIESIELKRERRKGKRKTRHDKKKNVINFSDPESSVNTMRGWGKRKVERGKANYSVVSRNA